MENKSSVGKYILMFEPKYVYYQYAVHFTPSGDVQITKVQKYSDKPYDLKEKSTVKKNTLGGIDQITTAVSDLRSFFKEYVPSSIFSYYGDNLHKMFIGYKYQERMYSMNYILNDQNLSSRLEFLNGSKIYDYVGRQQMIDLIMHSSNNSFLNFVSKEKQEGNTNLSNRTFDIASRLRMSIDSMEGFPEISELSNLLDEQLTYYKDYREMYLLNKHYQDYLEEEKIRLEKIKNTATKVSENKVSSEYEQLSLFDMPPMKIKKFN